MDSTLPQPPANRTPEPPAERDVKHVRGKRGLIWLLGGGAIVICGLVSLNHAIFRPQRVAHDRAEAINHLLSVGCSLMEFDSEYGSFPNAATAAEVKSNTGTALTLGDRSSNQLFRQLIAVGLKSEKPFWAKTGISPKKPDDIYGTDATALVAGEVGFAYISGLSTATHPECPLAMTPLLPGRRTFDTKPFAGKAIVLFTDNSTVVLDIDKHGRAILNGMDLFDVRQPFWGGEAPDIKWAE